jgi:hypothetical protein
MSQLMTLIGLGVVAYLVIRSEKYTAGASGDTSSGVPPVIITHDITQRMVQLTQQALVQKLGGKCLVYPLDTNYIRQEGEIFHCRMMFTVIQSNQFPYGVSVDSDVSVPGATSLGDASVVSLELQNMSTIDTMDAFDQFETGSQLQEQQLPTRSQLEAAFALS